MPRTRKTADPLTPAEKEAEEARLGKGVAQEALKRECAEILVGENEIDETPLKKILWPFDPGTGKRVSQARISRWRAGDVRFQQFCDEVRDQVGRAVSGPFTTHRSQINKLRELMKLAEGKGDYRTARALLADIARLSALDKETEHDPLARFGGIDPRDALRGELVGALEGTMAGGGEGGEGPQGDGDDPAATGRTVEPDT